MAENAPETGFRSGAPSVANADAASDSDISFSQRQAELAEKAGDSVASRLPQRSPSPKSRRDFAHTAVVFLEIVHNGAGYAIGEPAAPWPVLDNEDENYSRDAITRHLETRIALCGSDRDEFERLVAFMRECIARQKEHKDEANAWLYEAIPRFFGLAMKGRKDG
jgi:hypothetical protein